MYYATKRTLIIDKERIIQYGIADETAEFCFFTQNEDEALNLAKLLNECKVERVHVLDIIEDMFYT
ncbi:MAG: hypothetical protein J6R20_08170 [Clostridia bacterium]|nr:hypothetical protein [Clostridia bacterium]